MQESHPSVFLLDDDESVVLALSRLLQAEGFATRAWTSAEEFLAEHDAGRPGCLVADVLMPRMDGLQLQGVFAERGIDRPIVFITGQGDIPTVVRAMKAGAVTLLPKPVQRDQLVPAVREALGRDAAQRARHRGQEDVARRLASLTPREREVLGLVTTGMLNKQIAAQLGAAEKTIKVHRGRIMMKMQVRTAAALAGLMSQVERPRAFAHALSLTRTTWDQSPMS